ncbi:hypothetical protein M413DRAFT_31558 [Hebeloma cylindrosporum]|uniref:Uncharacterized protein n=1 Tax=Hebeloma cylindrosporum TaxID=76867 RepID=A0A0C3BWP6_HEBCY|nr:hypothetical protein M413DRAFT_31558 [Hebeloma cylindrosporum h7]
MANSQQRPVPRLPVNPLCSITPYVIRGGKPVKRLCPPSAYDPLVSPRKRLSSTYRQPFEDEVIQSSCAEELELASSACATQMDPGRVGRDIRPRPRRTVFHQLRACRRRKPPD